MKIIVKADGHNIRLWLPTSLLKSRLVYSIVKNAVAHKTGKRIKTEATEQLTEQRQALANDQTKVSSPITRRQILELYAALKQCIKVNGHFDIIDVQSHNGEKVLICV